MTFKRNQLRDAINVALCVGAASILSTGSALAQDANTPATPTDTQAKNLDTITVTGSRVRRVERETANPVVILDRAQIEHSGKLTIGEIVNELPNISGAPVTAAVNNGGGTGAATAELRGLTSVRTLVLIDGHRPGPSPVDLNSIPLALVERIEVLTEGSSTVYGSDAIGGVINFIMRKNYNGAQYTASYGESGQQDSKRKGQSMIVGQSGDKGNIVAGIEYNKFDAVPAGNRDFSKGTLSLLYGSIFTNAGSSRTPFGRVSLPANLQGQFGCTTVTNVSGHSGQDLNDYTCYTPANAFNYAPLNIILTPQERTNMFALGTYNVSDDIQAYMQVYHQKQTAQSQIAPLPFDAQSDGVTISADSYYNPFGVEFGPNGNEFRTRFNSLGQRIFNNTTTNDTVFIGLKGSFGQTWSWDAGFDYFHSQFLTNPEGYVFYAGLKQALGPSFKDVDGVVKCGTPGNVIVGCTPVNIFNIFDPDTVAALSKQAASPLDTTSFIQRELEFNASGDLFDLPAGAVKLAVGGNYRKEYQHNRVDFIAVTNGPGATCDISQEACTSPLAGSFDLKEYYAEAFIPILKDVPGAYQLNIDAGTRFSKYNIFSSTVSSKLAVEWRPIKDLLVRGSASDLFRAPTANNIFGGQLGNAPPSNGDFCAGLTPDGNGGAPGSYTDPSGISHAVACGPQRGTVNSQVDPGSGIPNTVTAGQTTGVISGAQLVGVDLKPEKGRTYDFGMVYDPEFVPGLSTSFDFYRINLNNLLTQLAAQTAETSCFNNEASQFCRFIHRSANGGLAFIDQPEVNLGSLKTEGFDFSIKYKLPVNSWGQFSVAADFTHINKYDIVVDPTDHNAEPLHLAGHFNNGFGNFAKWRGNLALNWSKGDWNAGYRIRWVGKAQVGDKDHGQGTSADSCNFQTGGSYGYCPLNPVVLKIPNYFESFVTAGYNFGSIGSMSSRVDVGVDNVFDKTPPFFYTNNVLNANTDVNTYDTIGRLFWARFTAKF